MMLARVASKGLSRRRFVAVLGLCATAAACTGAARPNDPTAPVPSPSTSANPVVRDGLSSQVVSAQMTPPSPAVGARVTVSAAGFLTREQLFERADIFLWPGEPDYIREIAYWEFTDDSLRVIRWSSGFTITLEGDLADDPVIVAKAREVAAEASRHIGYPIAVGPGGSVQVGLDPDLADEDAVAEARLETRNATVIGARIVFARRGEISGGPQAQYSNTFLHELGHVIGLGHSLDDRDVMTPAEGPGTRFPNYQPRESGCLTMIYTHRRAGNTFPDRDPAFGAASAARLRTTVIRN